MNKQFISILCMVLIISLPFSSAENIGELLEPEEFPDEQSLDQFTEGQETSLVINVNRYEPETLETDLIEDQGAPVYAYLSAIPTESLDFPRIIPPIQLSLIGGNKNFVRGYSYRAPKVYSWDDLGAVEVRIKRINEEDKVPERLDLDFRAKINFEAESTSPAIIGKQTFELKEKPLFVREAEEVYFDDASSIFNGRAYIRADNIISTSAGRGSARFDLYDSNGRKISGSGFSVTEGSESRDLSVVPGSNNPEDIFRIRVDRIIDRTKNLAEVEIKQFETSLLEDGFINHVLSEGLNVLGWQVQSILFKDGKCPIDENRKIPVNVIVLKHNRLKEPVFLIEG
jgi:hypothetical protein